MPNNNGRYIVLIAIVGATCFALMLGRSCIPRARHLFVPESVSCSLPKNTGELMFVRLGRHAFASEYSRHITLRSSEKVSSTHPLPVNTGWPTYLNLYWIEDDGRYFLRMEEEGDQYLLDLGTGTLYLIITFNERTYAGEFHTEEVEASGVGPPDDPSAAHVFVDGRRAEPIDSITANWKGKYIGAISGATNRLRFWSPAERAERKIEQW